MPLKPLPEIMIEPLVRAALQEDLGRTGDITTDAIIPVHQKWKGALVARQAGVVAGLDLARLAFWLMDPSVTFKVKKPDGSSVKPKDVIATIAGPARAIITGERVALNFLSHLSGIATATQNLVKAVKPHTAKICCTRKTTPGLRLLEKYAVRAGGGTNHRFGLYDAVLIKDNHIPSAGGVGAAVMRARTVVGRKAKIQLEVDNLDQLKEAMNLPIDSVLLDNMPPPMLKKAVKMVRGRFVTEASGRINLKTVKAIAASGVDRISVGSITHSAPILDIGLDEM
jgi:nicotinate-nucleotide pyrophosphorylase (carboxylating)